MQAILHAAGQLPILTYKIFWIADDRMPNMRHMGAQLVSSPGDRFKRKPRERGSGCFNDRIIGDRMAGAFLAMSGDSHDGFIFALVFRQNIRDPAMPRSDQSGDKLP